MNMEIKEEYELIQTVLSSLRKEIEKNDALGDNDCWRDDSDQNNGQLSRGEGINAFVTPWLFFKDDVSKYINKDLLLQEITKISTQKEFDRFSAAPYNISLELNKSGLSTDFVDTVTYQISAAVALKRISKEYGWKTDQTDEVLDGILINSLKWISDNSLPDGGWMGLNKDVISDESERYLSIYATWSVGEIVSDVDYLSKINKNPQLSDLIIEYNEKLNLAKMAMRDIVKNFVWSDPLFNLYKNKKRMTSFYDNDKIVSKPQVGYTVYALQFLLATSTQTDSIDEMAEELFAFYKDKRDKEDFNKGLIHDFYVGKDNKVVFADDSIIPFAVKVLSKYVLQENLDESKKIKYINLMDEFKELMIKKFYIKDRGLFGLDGVYYLYLTSRCVEALSFYVHTKNTLQSKTSTEFDVDSIIKPFEELLDAHLVKTSEIMSLATINLDGTTNKRIQDILVGVDRQNTEGLKTLKEAISASKKVNGTISMMNESLSEIIKTNDSLFNSVVEIKDLIKNISSENGKIADRITTLNKTVDGMGTEKETVKKFVDKKE